MPTTEAPERMPLCPVHQKIDNDPNGELILIYSHGCVACSLGERDLLLDLLDPFAPADHKEDSLSVLRRLTEFYKTHQGEGRVVVSYPAPSHDAPLPLAEDRVEAEKLVEPYRPEIGGSDLVNAITTLLTRVRAEQREASAKIADTFAVCGCPVIKDHGRDGHNLTIHRLGCDEGRHAETIAEAIRREGK